MLFALFHNASPPLNIKPAKLAALATNEGSSRTQALEELDADRVGEVFERAERAAAGAFLDDGRGAGGADRWEEVEFGGAGVDIGLLLLQGGPVGVQPLLLLQQSQASLLDGALGFLKAHRTIPQLPIGAVQVLHVFIVPQNGIPQTVVKFYFILEAILQN